MNDNKSISQMNSTGNGDSMSTENPSQLIKAENGSTIRDVIQAIISGQITGDVHIGDKIYTRSGLEELNDYLAQAVAAYEARMYQTLRQPPLPRHPYKSLYAFELKDAHLFFGRDAATQEMYDKVLNNRLTVLHARSGAGKTSLLNAGLSPRLINEGHLPVYAHTRPYEEDPTLAVKRAISPPSLGPWPKLLPELSLHEFLGLVCTHLSHQTQELIVIFDQFEEFLVSLPDPDLHLPFVRALSDCYEDSSLPVRFVISLRREDLWDLDEFQAFIPHILQNRYALPFMTRSEVEEAIIGPVLRLDREVSFEPALLEILLEDLGRDDVELTHLQIVCAKLYDSLPKDEKVITLDLYRSLGKTGNILATYLNEKLSELPRHKQSMARNVLKALVSSTATNRILSLAALKEQVPPDPDLMQDVLGRLVDTRLIRREDTADVTEYELAHVYLAAEIIHWVEQDELGHKRAQELLQRELATWRVHKTLVDVHRLDVLRAHFKYLTLDHEARPLLFQSALSQGHDVCFWLGQVEDKEAAIGQIADSLVYDRNLRKQIATDLKTNLEQPSRHPLLSALWTIFDTVTGTDKRNAARALWAFKAWLPIEETLRVVGILLPVWVLQSLPFVLVLGLLLLGSSRGWTLLNRERAIPGQWVLIPTGSFIMGSDQEEAAFAYSLCLEGALNKADCSDLERPHERWSGRQTDAALPKFAIMDNEVTNAQYQQCLNAGTCQALATWGYNESDANKPATNVSWAEAMTYCQWLGGRLPTEGEWEKAARGPGGNYFPWGNEWDPSKANLEHKGTGKVENIDEYAKSDISDYKVKNMAGNVREWTASAVRPHLIDEKFYNDILSPDEAAENSPVIVRGGSWENERSEGMGAMRGVDSISNRRPEIGFRCACPGGLNCRSPWNWRWIWLGEY